MSLTKLLNSERPNSFESERTIVSIVMRKPSLLSQVNSIITAEMFYNQKHKILFMKVSKMIDDGVSIDPITIKEELRKDNNLEVVGGIKEVMAIYGYAGTTDDNIDKCYIIKENYVRRLSAEYAIDLLKESLSYDNPIFTSIDKAVDRYANLQTFLTEVKKQTEIESIKEAEAEAMGIITGEIPIIDTPFIDFNANNFFLKGKVLTIVARPRMGKTAIALTLAEHLSKTMKVHFLSLEMTHNSLQMRRMSFHSGISQYDLYHDKESLIRGSSELQRQTTGNITIDDSTDITDDNLSGKVRQAVESGAEVIFLDYIQLLPSEITEETPKIEKASRLVQRIAKKYNVLFVMLAQANRGSEGRPPQMKDIKGSGAIEEVSDYIIGIDRPEVYDPNGEIIVKGDKIPNTNMAMLMSMKDRMGASDVHFWLVFQKEAMRFSNYSSLSQWEVEDIKQIYNS